MPEHQTGTTTDFALTRNEIIEEGYAKLGKLLPGASLIEDQLIRGIRLLNLLIKKEDNQNIEKNRNLWALDSDHLILIEDKFLYGVQEGLAPNILRLETAIFRDSSGDDADVDIINLSQYESKVDKNERGDPMTVRFIHGVRPADHKFLITPLTQTISDTSVVLVSGISYSCIQKHTSGANNEPSVGTDWPLFWKQTGVATTAWADATDYENGELIRYTFQKPLFEFNKHSDNPDMPLGWESFLIYSLATELAPEVGGVDLDTRRWIQARAVQEKADLFPVSRELDQHNQHINRTDFF